MTIAKPALLPLNDLAAGHCRLEAELTAAWRRVLDTSNFIGGPEVQSFQEEFASYCGTRFAVGVGNGTEALWLILKGLGIGPGDEVITSPFTFIATAEAITLCGAQVVFCDIDPTTYTLDPRALADCITERTRAVVVVHLHGQVADMEALAAICRQRRLWLVEDAAQAHGATYRGRRVGSLADAAAFSFYPGKNLGALGDAGAVVTDREDLALFVRQCADHGRLSKYEHHFPGTNSRLDALQAAVLRIKLRYLDDNNARRRTIADWYRQWLGDCPDVRLPCEIPGRSPVYHQFVVEVPRRDEIRQVLAQQGIQAGVHYPIPLHLQPAYRHLGYGPGAFPAAERAAQHVLSLPMFPELTHEQVARVCQTLRAALGHARRRAA
ncbi:MAG: erythromycin biosynthesis sensory transduction protein eryC1 [Gemmataceae bacterium]